MSYGKSAEPIPVALKEAHKPTELVELKPVVKVYISEMRLRALEEAEMVATLLKSKLALFLKADEREEMAFDNVIEAFDARVAIMHKIINSASEDRARRIKLEAELAEIKAELSSKNLAVLELEDEIKQLRAAVASQQKRTSNLEHDLKEIRSTHIKAMPAITEFKLEEYKQRHEEALVKLKNQLLEKDEQIAAFREKLAIYENKDNVYHRKQKHYEALEIVSSAQDKVIQEKSKMIHELTEQTKLLQEEIFALKTELANRPPHALIENMAIQSQQLAASQQLLYQLNQQFGVLTKQYYALLAHQSSAYTSASSTALYEPQITATPIAETLTLHSDDEENAEPVS